MHSNLSTTVSSSIGLKLRNGGNAIAAIVDTSEEYAHFAQAFADIIIEVTEVIEILYLKSDYELIEDADHEALYIRSLGWFGDSLLKVAECGYSPEMFYEGVYYIGLAAVIDGELTPSEVELFQEACEIITDSIWDHFANIEGGEGDSYGP